jgi:hypothetical protein
MCIYIYIDNDIVIKTFNTQYKHYILYYVTYYYPYY